MVIVMSWLCHVVCPLINQRLVLLEQVDKFVVSFDSLFLGVTVEEALIRKPRDMFEATPLLDTVLCLDLCRKRRLLEGTVLIRDCVSPKNELIIALFLIRGEVLRL